MLEQVPYRSYESPIIYGAIQVKCALFGQLVICKFAPLENVIAWYASPARCYCLYAPRFSSNPCV